MAAREMIIDRTCITTAAERVAGWLRRTPVIDLEAGAFGSCARLALKLELLQCSGTFKPRGAFNRILSSHVPPAGVIAASGGNHGAAVAYAAQRLGHRAEIYVPEPTPALKIDRLRQYGAQVMVTGVEYAESQAACDRRARETGALVVHPYDQPEVLAGQGTVGLEFDDQVPDLDTVLVAVGGGGLIAGIAAWFQNHVRVIGVEPVRAPSLAAALDAGKPVDVEVGGIAVDSLGARRIGQLAFTVAQSYVERVALVEDDAIREAQRQLWELLRTVAEPGGATALAALTSGSYQPEPDERVGVLVCGGNTDLRQFP